jgi:phosphoglycolate phosphatase
VRYRWVIWDWNGTLLDDAWLALETINELLGRRGLPLASPARYQEVFGFPLEGFCRRVGFDLAAETFEALSDQYGARYEERRLECRLRDRAREVLVALQRDGVRQSILSAYHQRTLEELVDHFGLTGVFDRVVGADNPYGERKVERGRRLLAEEGWPPREVVVIGDTLHDGEVARAMGVDCVLFPSGYQSAGRLQQGGHAVAADLSAAVALLGGPPSEGGQIA